MESNIIRVLHVLGGMNQGGVENLLMNAYRNIDRSKVQFDFLVNREGVFDEEIKTLGGKVYYIPSLQKVGQTSYIKNLDKFFDKHKEYKIIHSHLNQVTGLILERANKANIPVRIAHSHNNRYTKGVVTRLYKEYLGAKIKNSSNCNFACSKKAGEFLFGKHLDFTVINNSIETSKFIFNQEIRHKKRKELNISDDCFTIGCVARLSYQKNPIFLLRIFKKFLELNKNSKLILIGKGALKDKVLKYISINKIEDKIIMLEDRNDVNELMQAMDFFVLPSKYEGLGIVLVEAQAAGLKCITSKYVVAEEAKVTDLLEYYPLNKGAKNWAKQIYNNKDYTRRDTSIEIKNKNYDVIENAKNMEIIYKKLLEENMK